MLVAQVNFGSDGGKRHQREALKETAQGYLAALSRNGQLHGETLWAWTTEGLVAYVNVERVNSLGTRFHSQWGTSELQNVVMAFGRLPECRILDDVVPQRFPSWKRSKTLYLFTHAFSVESPIRNGDTGAPIPLYLLPISQETRADIGGWAANYHHFDNIWLGSSVLEIPAYQQLADPKSDLSVRGRKLCTAVEQATEIPTYYFLMRYWGRVFGEADRLCPICGGKWNTVGDEDCYPFPISDRGPFHQFRFRCEKCRLVSHCCSTDDEERYAPIGEFRDDS